jgi:hypothetical protein
VNGNPNPNVGIAKGTEIARQRAMTFRLTDLLRVFCIVGLFGFASCANPTARTVNDKSNAGSSRTGRIKQISQPTDDMHDVASSAGIRWPQGMRRLVVLPIYTARPIGESERDMDGIFRGELSKVVKYEIVQVSRQEMLSINNREAVSSAEILSADLIRVLKLKYGADAVLFTDFTVFRPYRPLAIGVRTKIVDLKTMEVLWMADGIVDSAEPDVADAASHFADAGLRMRYVSPTIYKGQDRELASGNQILLQSPRLFAAFVAHEAFSSLTPPVRFAQ